MRSLELRIPPLALTAIFAALIVSTSVLLPGLTAPFAYHRTVAPVFVGLGLAVLFGAALQFRLQRTTLDPRTPAGQQAASPGCRRCLPSFSVIVTSPLST